MFKVFLIRIGWHCIKGVRSVKKALKAKNESLSLLRKKSYRFVIYDGGAAFISVRLAFLLFSNVILCVSFEERGPNRLCIR